MVLIDLCDLSVDYRLIYSEHLSLSLSLSLYIESQCGPEQHWTYMWVSKWWVYDSGICGVYIMVGFVVFTLNSLFIGWSKVVRDVMVEICQQF